MEHASRAGGCSSVRRAVQGLFGSERSEPFCPKLAWLGKTDSVENVVTGGGGAVVR